MLQQIVQAVQEAQDRLLALMTNMEQNMWARTEDLQADSVPPVVTDPNLPILPYEGHPIAGSSGTQGEQDPMPTKAFLWISALSAIIKGTEALSLASFVPPPMGPIHAQASKGILLEPRLI